MTLQDAARARCRLTASIEFCRGAEWVRVKDEEWKMLPFILSSVHPFFLSIDQNATYRWTHHSCLWRNAVLE
jgi:hypothetical protein